MMNILMVQAKTNWYDTTREDGLFVNLNLGFLRTATICKRLNIGFDIVDCNNFNTGVGDVLNMAESRQPQLAIISLDLNAVDNAYRISHELKSRHPDIKIMWTSLGIGFLGPFVVLFKELVLKDDMIDFVLYGDEGRLDVFFEEFSRNSSAFSAGGIGYKKDGELFFNPLSKSSEYIEEDYNAVDMEDYIWRYGHEILVRIYVKKQRIIPVASGVGCAFACSFCINSNKEWKQLFKTKPQEMLLRQLTGLIDKYNPDVVWLQDDNFFINKERAAAVLELLNSRNVKWCGQGRLEYFREDYINEEFFKKYMAPGALWFGVGFETFSDTLRAKLNKKASTEDLEKAALLCNKYDVPFNPAFIYGTIEQTAEEFKNDVAGLLEFHRRYPKTTFSFQLWRPYPGTREFAKVTEKYKLEFPSSLQEFRIFSIECLDMDKYYPWLDKKRRSLLSFGAFLVALYCVYGRFGRNLISDIAYRPLVFCMRYEIFPVFKVIGLLCRILSKKVKG